MKLILARDRLGKKPLYYAWDGKQLLFASEVKALTASGLTEAQLNPSAIQAYLMFGSVPSPLTMMKGVQALEAADLCATQRRQIRRKAILGNLF